MTELPSLEELKIIQATWIRETITSGMIDKACLVVKHFGETVDVRNRIGNFKKLEAGDFIFVYYHYSTCHSPGLDRAMFTTHLQIADALGKEFVRITFREPFMKQDIEDFIVPGGWEDVARDLYEEYSEEQTEEEKEAELNLRNHLAETLHII